MSTFTNFTKTFFLWELLKGMKLTGTGSISCPATSPCSSRKKDAAVAALPRFARAAPLRERRRALHRLQAV